MAIFDLLGLPLLHGWVVDGADPAADVMRGLSYNQAVELAVSGGEGGDSAPAPPPAQFCYDSVGGELERPSSLI